MEYRRRTRHKLETRWRPGICLGVRRSTSEKIVGDSGGVLVVQSVRRNDESSRWDGQILLSIKGTPWQPMPGQEAGAELPGPLPLVPEQPEVPARPA